MLTWIEERYAEERHKDMLREVAQHELVAATLASQPKRASFSHELTMVAIRLAHMPVQLAASLRRRARRLMRRRALRRALQAAYGPFANRHTRWVSSFFDDHFLTVQAVPLLMEAWESNRRLTPAQLAAAWRAQLSPTNSAADELYTEAAQAAAAFMEMLEAELDANPELALSHEACSR